MVEVEGSGGFAVSLNVRSVALTMSDVVTIARMYAGWPAHGCAGLGVAGQSPPCAGSRRVDLPLERVIDDVASMGFSRREVREVVLDMMQSGQAVDLNVVVDRLMNRNQ